MTSRVATNFKFNQQGQVRYLEVNQDGQPYQGQVPLTYQVYSGNGNETIVYDGSDVFLIDSTLPGGVLTLDCTQMQNYFGRAMQFVAYKTLVNNVVIDFGTGLCYFPPFGGSSNTITLDPPNTPTTSKFVFFSPTKVVVSSNSTVSPSRIIPGGPGQVLTTNSISGLVDWENPQSVAPRYLNFKWSTDISNDLNQNTATAIAWIEDGANNTTDLTLASGTAPGTCRDFIVNTPGPYTITHKEFMVADPSIGYRNFIAINSDIWAYNESQLGLTGSSTSGSITINLVAGDRIRVFEGNAAGAVTPITPLDSVYGNLSIIQYVY